MRETTGRALQQQIKQLILDRGLRPGEPMPTETDLVQALGVSRNSLREALKALQALDIVEIRHGFGTYVGPVSLAPLTDGLTFRILLATLEDRRGIRELLDVRETLEVGLIRRAAAATGDGELAALAEIVERMDAAADRGEQFPVEDRRFHETLYEPLGNTLVVQLLRSFWEVFHRVEGDLPDPPDPKEVAGWHRAIVDALSARDVTAAEQALRDHFQQIQRRVASA